MKTVSVIAQKGGAGKTTLALATACAATEQRLTAAVFDLDPQATAASWSDRRRDRPPVVMPAQPPRLARMLEAAASEGVDLAVVDTAPRVEQGAVAAARAAALVLVPCRPAVYDPETVAATRDLVRAVAPRTRVLCVLNGTPPRGPRERQARELLADLDIPVCGPALGLRAAVDYAAAAGSSTREYEAGGKAAAESVAVYAVVRRLLALPDRRPADPPARTTSRPPTGTQANLTTGLQVNLPTRPRADLPPCRPANSHASPDTDAHGRPD